MKKRALLMGGFTKVQSLAAILHNAGYMVTVIHSDEVEGDTLMRTNHVTAICGDFTLPDVLRAAGASSATLAVAMGSEDADNLIACQLCKRMFRIPRTIALLEDAQKTALFYKLGIDSVVCEISSLKRVVEQQEFLTGMAPIVPISDGRLSMVEVPIAETSPIVNQKIWELDLPPDVIIGCILRGDQSLVPKGDTPILAGDVLIVIAAGKQELKAVYKLTGRT